MTELEKEIVRSALHFKEATKEELAHHFKVSVRCICGIAEAYKVRLAQHRARKFTDAQVIRMRSSYPEVSMLELHRMYETSYGAIKNIIYGHTYKDVGGTFHPHKRKDAKTNRTVFTDSVGQLCWNI